ncbi:jun-like transcription factor [Malassezia japonica]|uniref:Jun-like transcription factor n=1 Tax=Malassezia japonica TaxID=223818 RepID=A0AAF0EXQ1_9BASI|nr:jun-like transcription factor [Malassezia japonica]WFD38875.1 jun-like transcription factor [Malassezia japonica]
MAKSSKSEGSESVVVSSDAVKAVHAFLLTHAKPKLAAKLADQYPNLGLSDDAEKAEKISNALVSTVKSALAVPSSELAVALQGEKKKTRKADEATDDKKAKKAKKAKKSKGDEEADVSMADETADVTVEEPEAPEEEPAEEPAEVSITETVAPNAIAVTETVESPAHKKKKKTTGERFQRVKSDQVVFLDDRLRDMSYDAKSGAGDYGARASADLMVTQGKGFTKEKNKKKRGSYRGGLIDQGSHSIKFTYDDE